MKYYLIIAVSLFLVIGFYLSKAGDPAELLHQTTNDVAVTAEIDKEKLIAYLKQSQVPLHLSISNKSNGEVNILLLHSPDYGIYLFSSSKPDAIDRVFPKETPKSVSGLIMHLNPNESQTVDVVYPKSAFDGLKYDLMAGVSVVSPSYNGVVRIALSKPIILTDIK